MEKKDDGEKEKEKKLPKVKYFSLYRFAEPADILLIALGWLAAIVVGIAEPVVMIIFGKAVDDFATAGKFSVCDQNSTLHNQDLCALTMEHMTAAEHEMIKNMTNHDPNEIMNKMTENIYWFIGVALISWTCGYIQMATLMTSAQRQVTKLRSVYFRSILRQDVGYFDTHDTGELTTRMFDDVKKIQNGIAEKVGLVIQSGAQFIGGLLIGFIYGWKMVLGVFAVLPLMGVAGYIWFKVSSDSTKNVLDAYAAAGGIAEEVLSSIRTVTAFSGQKEELERYKKPLKTAETAGINKSVTMGAAAGFMNFVIFASFGLAFWYGAKLVVEDEYTVGQKLTVFFVVIIAAFALSQFSTNFEHCITAQTAAHSVYQILDRIPEIDIQSEAGKTLEAVQGIVEFKNINFTYPARENQEVLKNVSFTVEAGKTTAFCGQSGCGKSTCFQLIKRFYDPNNGSVLIDGIDVKEINVKSLRSIIGVVSQEPVLFETTIEENIRLGRLDVTREQIEIAAKSANAFEFIQKLPEKWETQVGEGGATLSGGQKQRIAIARALVRDPKILLLDEATSALDTESESVVQKALENASKGRTTIVIAHRLSTIRNADKIIGFNNGKIMEEGTHDQLMKIENGVYFHLCNMQTFEKDPNANDDREIGAKKSVKELLEEKKSEALLKDAEEKDLKEFELPYSKILKMNSKEFPMMILGGLLAMTAGAVQPIWAIIFADVLALYAQYNCAINSGMQNATGEFESQFYDSIFNATQIRESEYCNLETFNEKVLFLSLMFIVLGLGTLVSEFGYHSLFGTSGERLTTRLRKLSFKKLLQLELEYFDDPMNSTGALTTRLASDAPKVHGATGMTICTSLKSFGAFACGFTIGFYYSWMLTLFCLAFVPFIIVATEMMMSLWSDKVGEEEQKAYEDAGKVATEATINIRTVADLGQEEEFVEKYKKNISNVLKGKTRKINLYGILYGSNLGIVFFMYAGVFKFSAWMIATDKVNGSDFSDIYRVLFAIMFAAMTAGEAGSQAPDYGQAIIAAKRIFKLLDRESEIDPENDGGKKPDACNGEITFENVEFQYPTRPDVKVLKGLNLTVKPGETLALVGQSGCGKSTCIQLLERFYNGSGGNIKMDNHRICELNLKWLRNQIGFVQQEPILFNKTIEENILYGLDQSGTSSTDKNKVGVKNDQYMDAMNSAAAEANALKFIEELPDKFDTNCGKKGSQLSGGQKQRVAIARAIVRQPKILLLDEATSALDAESEKLVQEALNKAQEGRTCILIAHRLSTVINADKIAVIDNGVISEIGTHAELINKKGAYYSLVNSQL